MAMFNSYVKLPEGILYDVIRNIFETLRFSATKVVI